MAGYGNVHRKAYSALDTHVTKAHGCITSTPESAGAVGRVSQKAFEVS